jgi:hypothetical protein
MRLDFSIRKPTSPFRQTSSRHPPKPLRSALTTMHLAERDLLGAYLLTAFFKLDRPLLGE